MPFYTLDYNKIAKIGSFWDGKQTVVRDYSGGVINQPLNWPPRPSMYYETLPEAGTPIIQQPTPPSPGGGGSGAPVPVAFSSVPTLTNLVSISMSTASAPIAFTPPSNGVAGSSAYTRLVADGVLANTPTFAGFTEAQGNLGYDSTAGAVNLVKFFFDGLTYWYSILGAVGATAVPAPIQTLSNFRTNVAGTQLLFDNTGAALTALTGTLLAGTSRTLTFVSATVASISGAAITNAQAGITATLTSTTPAIPVAITGVAVTNTVPGAALAKQTIAYGATPVVTRTGDAISFTGAGASVVTPINTANAFEVIIKSGKAADVFIFDGVIASTYSWTPPAASVKFGGYYANGNLYATSSASAAEAVATGGQPANGYLKFRKSGNDVIMSSSADGTTYTDVKTFTGVLSGLPTVYLNIYNVAGGTCAPEVSFYA